MFVCILPEKAVPEMTNTVSGGTLNPTHSLTHVVVVLVVVAVVVVIVVVVLDYVCEAYNNPPDFFLDVLNGSVAVTTADDKLNLPNGQSFTACFSCNSTE